jgi:hypothetical protein
MHGEPDERRKRAVRNRRREAHDDARGARERAPGGATSGLFFLLVPTQPAISHLYVLVVQHGKLLEREGVLRVADAADQVVHIERVDWLPPETLVVLMRLI